MNYPPHISEKDGHLYIGEHDTNVLAEKYGTPLYVTDEQRIRDNYQSYYDALKGYYDKVQVLYAAKANGNLAVMKIFASLGAGADIFSAGELHLALAAGMNPDYLLYNGSSKTTEDLSLALEKKIRVSLDSVDELRQLSAIAQDAGVTAEVSFRVNPAMEVPTHPKIATGLATSKFGIHAGEIVSAYQAAMDAENILPVGIHCHIGSQILEVAPFAKEAEVLISVASEITDIGVKLRFMDVGGGLGIPYHHDTDPVPTPAEYADAVMPVFLDGINSIGIKPEFWVEPGRFLMADSTVLLTRVNSVKQSHKKFVNVDAGFNLLARPAMYDSYHEVVVANKTGPDYADDAKRDVMTVTGPICETGDILAHDRLLPAVESGDLIAVLDTGAYGFSMSSQYNSRPRCAEVMVNGSQEGLMRRRESIIDIKQTMKDLPWQK
ncbi:diaminopimelate decarboxylase [Methanogenium organophilum]|uniref:Diaminopimelate decarboxylase n=1 Tax=Methanogenium organophilum TaxID=2199 RepID=A0A9X9S448_METOG|nr:diaminopimelate decarboxylase [Methanogenium organophilum]WAI01321.1 diaminopimelate decarboxylase [Methanogenium organophilum]